MLGIKPAQLAPKLARDTGVDKRSRTFTPWSHVVSLLYAQLTHAIGTKLLNRFVIPEINHVHAHLLRPERGSRAVLENSAGENLSTAGFRSHKVDS